ncbi:DUF2971 domain-containing protein [Rhizobium acidisoli]|uniref:DUF2971 domain-containing protein n=1 Tax=Rhizobium acidisoli TaxID=1538158 RepID=A0AAE5TXM5_9HYPH|nr:DUF2971 domain-containing protein [Rhizobium acidisoli]KPH05970.1 hypothetical protein AOG23_24960 [Rhizobium acidisoli]QAS79540.1 DUF2971 domain-containing protein [Rhizobium acidisoli]
MRVYHFIDEKWGLDNIRRQRLKVARISDLNDPFELEIASPDPAVRSVFRRTKAELNEWAGLLCFSRDWRNPVQWAHYADRHRGMCLGFDIPDPFLTPVVYRSRLLKADMIAMNGSDDKQWEFYKKVLSTKYAHWKYENEVRLFIRIDEQDTMIKGLFFKAFDREMDLKEVIVGHRSELLRRDLVDAIGENAASVRLRRGRLAFNSYRVVTQRNSALWE